MKRTTEQNALILHAMILGINWSTQADTFSPEQKQHIKRMHEAGIKFQWKGVNGEDNIWVHDANPVATTTAYTGLVIRPAP